MSECCPRLIEVALPIREISAESVRDKSLRHGHISTLHLWWARRPLAACRAIVFASVVPDPDDDDCPEEFRRLVVLHLKTQVPAVLRHYSRGRRMIQDADPYRPYDGIPDTLRNRLLTFIAKWSPEQAKFDREGGKEPKPGEVLDDRSLVKWETSDPDNAQGREILRIARELVKVANGGVAPTVLDPFAGGGAIPLEAGRLGCRAIANDYNPVAYLILRGTCEFPQKYGQPGVRTIADPNIGDMDETVSNVLVHDVDRWARWILARAKEKIGHLYPAGEGGRPVVAYLWARTAPCSNPSCRGEMPLLRSLLVCDKDNKKVALTMEVDKERRVVEFGVLRRDLVRENGGVVWHGAEFTRTDGTMLNRGKVRCPFCDQVSTTLSDLHAAGRHGRLGERLVAVITDGGDGKHYRSATNLDAEAHQTAMAMAVDAPHEFIEGDNRYMSPPLYGMTTWGSLFNHRQLLAMNTLVECFHDALAVLNRAGLEQGYREALVTYLALWVSRNAMRMTTVGRWNPGGENVETPFDGARLPFKCDYPEANPFSDVSGGCANQTEWVLGFLRRERANGHVAGRVALGDAATLPLASGSVSTVVTDPPYFDEAAYADLSDFFYVWLKRLLGDVAHDAVATPATPKADEATALKHRFGGDSDAANRHFTMKLGAVFTEARRTCSADGVFSIIFAHQETEAWSALVASLFAAGLSIDATWPVDMERKNRPRGIGSAALETSIVVVCRPRTVGAAASFRDVRREVEQAVRTAVHRFWGYGFRGADLVVACYGPAVGVFGQHERVEKADGTPVTVPELLGLARTAARDAIAGEFRGDALSTLYYVWANLYGTSEQSWDDARLVVQIGGDAQDAMEVARGQGVFVVDGASCRLALLKDRSERRGLGADPNPPLIDALHRAMQLWKDEQRATLVAYLYERGLLEDGPYWKLAQALFEVLPRDQEDWKLVSALLGERETLRTEAKRSGEPGRQPAPGTLEAETGERWG